MSFTKARFFSVFIHFLMVLTAFFAYKSQKICNSDEMCTKIDIETKYWIVYFPWIFIEFVIFTIYLQKYSWKTQITNIIFILSILTYHENNLAVMLSILSLLFVLDMEQIYFG